MSDVRDFVHKAAGAMVRRRARSEPLVLARVLGVSKDGYQELRREGLPKSDEDGNFAPYSSDNEAVINHFFGGWGEEDGR